jgi:predicted phage-related endonuclease
VTATLVRTASEAEWLEARRKGVTASEIAVVLGLSPYGSPFELYHRKTGTLPEQPQSDDMALGVYMEQFVAGRFGNRYLLAVHDRLCVSGACPRRITLVAHLHRTARQAALLAPPAEPDPLF